MAMTQELKTKGFMATMNRVSPFLLALAYVPVIRVLQIFAFEPLMLWVMDFTDLTSVSEALPEMLKFNVVNILGALVLAPILENLLFLALPFGGFLSALIKEKPSLFRHPIMGGVMVLLTALFFAAPHATHSWVYPIGIFPAGLGFAHIFYYWMVKPGSPIFSSPSEERPKLVWKRFFQAYWLSVLLHTLYNLAILAQAWSTPQV